MIHYIVLVALGDGVEIIPVATLKMITWQLVRARLTVGQRASAADFGVQVFHVLKSGNSYRYEEVRIEVEHE